MSDTMSDNDLMLQIARGDEDSSVRELIDGELAGLVSDARYTIGRLESLPPRCLDEIRAAMAELAAGNPDVTSAQRLSAVVGSLAERLDGLVADFIAVETALEGRNQIGRPDLAGAVNAQLTDVRAQLRQALAGTRGDVRAALTLLAQWFSQLHRDVHARLPLASIHDYLDELADAQRQDPRGIGLRARPTGTALPPA